MSAWPLMLPILVGSLFTAGAFAFLAAILLRHGYESCRDRRGGSIHV